MSGYPQRSSQRTQSLTPEQIRMMQERQAFQHQHPGQRTSLPVSGPSGHYSAQHGSYVPQQGGPQPRSSRRGSVVSGQHQSVPSARRGSISSARRGSVVAQRRGSVVAGQQPIAPSRQYQPRLRHIEASQGQRTKVFAIGPRQFPYVMFEDIEVEESPEVLNVEEPDEGILAASMNQAEFETTRRSIKYLEYVPQMFMSRAPPMRQEKDFRLEEKITSAEELLACTNFLQVKFLALPGTRLNKRLQEKLRQCTALEVVILSHCELGKFPPLSNTIRYLDISHNGLRDIQAVIQFLMNTPAIEFIHLGHNAFSRQPHIRRRFLMAAPTLRFIDGQPVEPRERATALLETRKDAAQLQWDAVVCALPEVAKMRCWLPLKLTVLDVSNSSIRTMHVGGFRNLTEIHASHNFLNSLSGHGLEQLDKLEYLDVSYNKITQHDQLNTLGWIPRLVEVVFQGNQVQYYRLHIIFITRLLAGTNRAPGIQIIDGQEVTLSERVQAHQQLRSTSTQELAAKMWQLATIQTFGHQQIWMEGFLQNICVCDMSRLGLPYADFTQFTGLQYLNVQYNNFTHVLGIDQLRQLRFVSLAACPNLDYSLTVSQLKNLPLLMTVELARDPQQAQNFEYRLNTIRELIPCSFLVVLDRVRISTAERVRCLASMQMDPAALTLYAFRCATQIAIDIERGAGLKLLERLVDIEEEPRDTETAIADGETQAIASPDHSVTSPVSSNTDVAGAGNPVEPIATPTESQTDITGSDSPQLTTSQIPKQEIVPDTPLAVASGNVSDSSDEDEVDLKESIRKGKKVKMDYYSYHPEHVLSSVQFDPALVKVLNLSGLGFSQEHLDFSGYINLEELTLANNYLTSFQIAGITQCKNLKRLDLSFNRIQTTPEEAIRFILEFPLLEAIAFRDNPCQQNPAFRHAILAGIDRLHDPNYRLNFIDEQITIMERVQAFKRAQPQAPSSHLAEFKFHSAVNLARPSAGPIVSLDLSAMDLNFIDFRPFAETLEELYLASNSISHVRGTGLDLCQKLRILDLRANKIKNDEIVELVLRLPHLEALGIDQNPQMKKKSHRTDFLTKLLPKLSDPWTPFTELDMRPIPMGEIMKIWMDKGGSREEVGKFHFNYLLRTLSQQKGFPRSKISEFRNLRFVQSDLMQLDLAPMSSLEDVILGHNHLDDMAIRRSGIVTCKKIHHLDLSHNNISNIETLVAIIDRLPELQSIELAGNPCMSSKDARSKLIGTLQCMLHIDCKLKAIDETPIEISERLTALGTHQPARIEDVYRLQFGLVCRALNITEDSTHMDLRDKKLHTIEGISKFKKLESLNVSRNLLSTLPHKELAQLSNLRFLDISHNTIDNWQIAVQSLQRCHSLQELRMVECGKSSEVSDPSDYAMAVCKILRNLVAIDGYRNPVPLEQYEYMAIMYLHSICPKGAGPNTILNLDLRQGEVKSIHFVACIRALSYLKTEQLSVPECWMSDIDNSRFMLIHMAKHLRTLGEHEISTDEKANSLTVCRRLEEDESMFFLSRPDLPTEADLEHLSEEQYAEKVAQVNMEDFALYATDAYARIVSSNKQQRLGNLLTKVEIATTFNQLLGLVLLLVPTFQFPNFLNFIDTITQYLSLDVTSWVSEVPMINWIKYIALFMLLGIFGMIYSLDPKQGGAMNRYHYKWCGHLCRTMFVWLIGIIGGGVAAFFIEDDFIEKLKVVDLTNGAVSFFAIFGGIWTIVFLIYLLIACRFHARITDEAFWFDFIRLKKRGALFLMTTAYLPIIKAAIGAFVCVTNDDGDSVIESFPSQSCGTSILTFSVIQYLAIVVIFVAGAGLPLFLSGRVRAGVAEIDKNFNIQAKLAKVSSKKGEGKEAHKEAVLQFRRDWNSAVRQYSTAQSYLYQNYRRSFRHYKIFQMLEKAIIIPIILFLQAEQYTLIRLEIVTGVVFLYFAVSLFSRPFSDWMENVMDIFARLSLTLTLIATLAVELEYIDLELLITWAPRVILGSAIILIFFLPADVIRGRRMSARIRREAAAAKGMSQGRQDNTQLERQISEYQALKRTQTTLRTLAPSKKSSNAVLAASELRRAGSGQTLTASSSIKKLPSSQQLSPTRSRPDTAKSEIEVQLELQTSEETT